jgi:hypothetical protein
MPTLSKEQKRAKEAAKFLKMWAELGKRFEAAAREAAKEAAETAKNAPVRKRRF